MMERRIKIVLDQTDARNKANQLNASFTQTGRSADNLNKRLNNTRKSGDDAAKGLQKTSIEARALKTTLSRLAASVALVFSTRAILEYAEAFTKVQNQLRQTVNGQQELNEKFERISQIALDSRANLEGTAKLYTRFRIATDEATFSNERLLRVTETVNKGLALSGATALESAGALLQLSQAVASGVLRGQEYNSVAEQAPVILRAIAAETGKTMGELRAFAAEGGITSELLITSLENYGSTVDRVFAKSTKTFGQSLEIARTQAIKFVGASELIGQAVTGAGEGIEFLAENLQTIQNIIVGLTVLFGARFVGSIFASVNALRILAAQTFATKITYDALGVAVGRTTALMSASAVASRGLGAAMAFLGGPAGVVFLAAAALVYFGSEARNNKKDAAELTAEIDKLVAKYLELNEAGKRVEREKLEIEANSIREQRKLIQERLDAEKKSLANRPASGGGLGGIPQVSQIANLQKQLSDYEKQLDEIADKQSALFTATLPTPTTSPEAEEKSFEDREAELQKLLDIEGKAVAAQNRLNDARIKAEQKRVEEFERSEAQLAKLFEEQQERSRRVVDGLVSENALIQESLMQRSMIYEQYGSIIYDNYAEPFERQRALLEVSLAEQENSLALALQNELAGLAERRQRLVEDDKLTDAARKEANILLDEQALLLREQFQQRLSEIDRNGAFLRIEIDREEAQSKIDFQQQIQNAYLDTASAGISALLSLAGGSKKAGKALKLVQAGISAFQVYANSQAAAFQILATPPGPILNPSLGPLAAAMMLKGKISAAGIIAGAAAETFSSSGGSAPNLSAGGGNAAIQTPNLPQAPEQVQNFEDLGRQELLGQLKELAAGDIQIPARYMLQYLAAEQAARRIGPG